MLFSLILSGNTTKLLKDVLGDGFNVINVIIIVIVWIIVIFVIILIIRFVIYPLCKVSR